MPDTLRRFLDDYRDAFNRLDGVAVAALYAEPSGIVDATGYTHWSSGLDIARNMTALCDLYRADGYERTDYADVNVIEQGAVGAVLDVEWTITRRDALPPRRFRTTYNVIRSGESWRVQLCTAYQETRLRPAP